MVDRLVLSMRLLMLFFCLAALVVDAASRAKARQDGMKVMHSRRLSAARVDLEKYPGQKDKILY